jgi:invasion protein IalB
VPAARPPAAPPPAASDPQRTTATFGDWTLRCTRQQNGPQTCQVDQVLSDKGQSVAQTVFTRPRPGDPLRLNFAVQVNVTLTSPPLLVGAEGETGATPIELTWRRCVPTACIADAIISEEQLKQLRARAENGRIQLQDSAGRAVTLPFGPRGLGQALDALAKEAS